MQTASRGYRPLAVSADSMTASVPSKTALATSLASARVLSKFRPKAQIYAFTHIPAVCNRMNLLWGVQSVIREHALNSEEMLNTAEQELLRAGRVNPGDVLGVVAGTQMSSGSTNFMRLHVVKET